MPIREEVGMGSKVQVAYGQRALNIAEELEMWISMGFADMAMGPSQEHLMVLMQAISILKVSGWALVFLKDDRDDTAAGEDIPF